MDLTSNDIGPEGAAKIAHVLETRSLLTLVQLDSNAIGDAGATAIASALKVNSSLMFLHLYANGIGSEGAVALAEAVRINDTLAHLSLNGNDIEDDGAMALLAALRINRSIVRISLESNPMNIDVNSELNQLMSRNSGFQQEAQDREKLAFVETMEKPNSKGPWNRSKLMIVGHGRAGRTFRVATLSLLLTVIY